MSAPFKPWERQGDVNHRQPPYQPDQTPSFIPASPDFMPGNGGGGSYATSPRRLPPLPPRPVSAQNSYGTFPRQAYNSYGNMGMYGSGMYGGGSGMYGGGGYRGFGQYGMNGLPDSSDGNGFIQIAEDSSRQAFQSIESIVHAFGSVSMMLDSTYHAVYSTFRAVLGVADHFNRMKSQFAQIFSALAVVRTLRWLYHRLLYLIGLRSQDPSLEAMWRSGNSSLPNASQITETDLKASKSSWPIVLFLGVVFGGPYLIWRLLSSLVPTKSKPHGWMTGQEEHYAAVGQYPFQAKMRGELSFVAGQQLILAPKDQQPNVQGWLLASNGTNSGLVPANYLKILGRRPPQLQQVNAQQKRQGNQVVASRIPSIPSPQLGTHQPVPHHSTSLVSNFGAQPGTPPIHQRLPPPSQAGAPLGTPQSTWQGAPQSTWQGAPQTTLQGAPQTTLQGAPQTTLHGAPQPTWQGAPQTTLQGAPQTTLHGAPQTTWQGAPLTTQGAPLTTQGAPLTTQGAPLTTQGAPLTTQGAPLTTQGAPLTTQGAPLTTQGAPLTTQGAPLTTQGAPLTTQGAPLTTQGAPLTTQGAPLTTQGAPLTTQGAPQTTQQGPIVTTQEAPKNLPSTPPQTPPDTRVASQDSLLPLQDAPPFIPEGVDVDVLRRTSPSREGGGFSTDEFDETSEADNLNK